MFLSGFALESNLKKHKEKIKKLKTNDVFCGMMYGVMIIYSEKRLYTVEKDWYGKGF